MSRWRHPAAILLISGVHSSCYLSDVTRSSRDSNSNCNTKCDKYNYMFHSAYGDKRRQLCSKETECVFVGDLRSGKCMSLSSYIAQVDEGVVAAGSVTSPSPVKDLPTLNLDDLVASINNSILSQDQASVLKSMLVSS